jgi:hypothetical protein
MLPDKSPEIGSEPTRDLPRSGERRRLLRGGLAAAPVLLTVASRPVLGQTTCLAASAMTSIAPSGNRSVSVCTGLTPEQWKAIADQWPSPYCATTQPGITYFQTTIGGQEPTKFHCPTTGLGGRVYGTRSMIDVIDLTQGGRNLDSLGRYIVAALLNARAGRTPVLNETGVRMMWNDLVNRGYYEPTAGIRWTSAEIVAYLKTTMG